MARRRAEVRHRPLAQNGVRRWLEDAHHNPQNSPRAVAFAAAETVGWVRPSAEGYANARYAGREAHPRPLHDAVYQLNG